MTNPLSSSSSCPCCVCVQNIALDIPDWLPSSNVQKVLKGNNFVEKVAATNREPMREATSPLGSFESTATTTNTLSSTNTDRVCVTAPVAPRVISKSFRSFRVSMDGNIYHHDEALSVGVIPSSLPTLSAVRPPHRTASVGQQDLLKAGIYGYGEPFPRKIPEGSSSFERRLPPKPLLRMESLTPKLSQHTRMSRRCSVTKYSLDDSFQQFQLSEKRNEKLLLESVQVSPPGEAKEKRQRRLNRRCSVTKFNLEETTIQNRVPNKVEQETLPAVQPSFELLKRQEFGQQGLFATPESNNGLRIKTPWGRAA